MVGLKSLFNLFILIFSVLNLGFLGTTWLPKFPPLTPPKLLNPPELIKELAGIFLSVKTLWLVFSSFESRKAEVRLSLFRPMDD